MSQVLFFILIGILSFAIYGAYRLSLVDYRKKNICPKVFGIPACYLVLLFFILAFMAHVLSSVVVSSIWFYGFIAIPFLLALTGTITELSGKVICPRTSNGTPMCYISLVMCLAFLTLKAAENKFL